MKQNQPNKPRSNKSPGLKSMANASETNQSSDAATNSDPPRAVIEESAAALQKTDEPHLDNTKSKPKNTFPKVRYSFVIKLLLIIIAFFTMMVTYKQLKMNTSITINQLNQEVSKHFVETPKHWVYFNLDRSLTTNEEREKWRQEKFKQFKQLDQDERQQLTALCEMLADSLDTIYIQRDGLAAEDWNHWWSYLCDAYDDSLLLQQFLNERNRWYELDDDLRSLERRQRLYRNEVFDYLPFNFNEGRLGDSFPVLRKHKED